MVSPAARAARNSGLRASLFFVVLPAALVFAVLACGDDDEAGNPAGSCDTLASRCHPYSKEALGHECHELGHDGNDNACFPRLKECLAACPETEAGTTHPVVDSGSPSDEASTSDAPSDGPPAPDAGDICTPYCECLIPTCGTQTGFPFASVDACKSACSSFGSEQKTCWPKWCEKAKPLANKTHSCEHAWGKLGLDECETLP